MYTVTLREVDLSLQCQNAFTNLKLIINSYQHFHVLTENYKNILTCISLSVLVYDSLVPKPFPMYFAIRMRVQMGGSEGSGDVWGLTC